MFENFIFKNFENFSCIFFRKAYLGNWQINLIISVNAMVKEIVCLTTDKFQKRTFLFFEKLVFWKFGIFIKISVTNFVQKDATQKRNKNYQQQI